MKTFEFLFVWWWFFSKETVNCSWSDKELLAVMYVYILMKISRNLMKKHFRIFTNIFKYKNSLIFFKNIKQILNSDWMRNLKLLLNIWNTQTYTVHQISSAAVWTVLEQIIFTSWHISVGMHYSTTPPVFSMFLVRSHIGSPIPAQPHGTLQWLCFHWFLMLRSSVSRSPSHRVAGVTIVTWFSVLRRERFTWSCVSVRSSQTAESSATSWQHGEAANHKFHIAAHQPIRAQPWCFIRFTSWKIRACLQWVCSLFQRGCFFYMLHSSSNNLLIIVY